ncbi:deoxyribodipyrimidine photo-lyase, partial [bacterium]|nr:deoxyribodipyrimidine photo-lyase [bacterium]
LALLCNEVYTIFIFTPEQINPDKNKYFSKYSYNFMLESLDDLSKEIAANGGKLITLCGENISVIKHCIQTLDIDIVAYNLDITPYAKNRDKHIEKLCKEMNVELSVTEDYYLIPQNAIMTTGNTPYLIFTPFYNQAIKYLRSHRVTNHTSKPHFRGTTKLKICKKSPLDVDNPAVKGGRDNALKHLRVDHSYRVGKDKLSEHTSMLSAYIKFGCVSIREVYLHWKSEKEFIRQLLWRDFYANVLYNYGSFESMKPIKGKWETSVSNFNKWCNGVTGYPLVDAAMRQLNQTGYMHNRGRLVAAGFLVKTLLISWQKGERYFAQHLIDYDPASNNMNWQWCASTGTDSMPYFRIFNPFMQQIRFDPNCEYIKRWIPELKDVPVKDISKWDKSYEKYKDINY